MSNIYSYYPKGSKTLCHTPSINTSHQRALGKTMYQILFIRLIKLKESDLKIKRIK